MMTLDNSFLPLGTWTYTPAKRRLDATKPADMSLEEFCGRTFVYVEEQKKRWKSHDGSIAVADYGFRVFDDEGNVLFDSDPPVDLDAIVTAFGENARAYFDAIFRPRESK